MINTFIYCDNTQCLSKTTNLAMKNKSITQPISRAFCKCCGAELNKKTDVICPECKNGQTKFDVWKLRHPIGSLLLNAALLPILLLIVANVYTKFQKDSEETDKRILEVQSSINALRAAGTSFRTACFTTLGSDCRKSLDSISERFLTQANQLEFVVRRYAPDAQKSLMLFKYGVDVVEIKSYDFWQAYLHCPEQSKTEEICGRDKRRGAVLSAKATLYIGEYLACYSEAQLNKTYIFQKSDSQYCNRILIEDRPLVFDEPSAVPETENISNQSEGIASIFWKIMGKACMGTGLSCDSLRGTR